MGRLWLLQCYWLLLYCCVLLCSCDCHFQCSVKFPSQSQSLTPSPTPFPTHLAALTHLPTGKRREGRKKERIKEQREDGREKQRGRNSCVPFWPLLLSCMPSLTSVTPLVCTWCTLRPSSQPNPLLHTSHTPMQPS